MCHPPAIRSHLIYGDITRGRYISSLYMVGPRATPPVRTHEPSRAGFKHINYRQHQSIRYQSVNQPPKPLNPHQDTPH
ncbi:hypothetical protein M430DRAFT_182503 [Amorphotheca resinae ATCC 22711]|uniref:Uncharacterized protein n=1 Tax=Amorphotheca resinae ATCC 22711 TaxID=857342 RepID=A0A2T3ARU5_AMORE|nr:hypothetical protein M430DRAFT_182503 [Amorphotheca resinae ATCC 22711]PSS09073.1 hypothetical protein M430DRAFT_182503 [Amorphotheca resinae ATCC 22711]